MRKKTDERLTNESRPIKKSFSLNKGLLGSIIRDNVRSNASKDKVSRRK